MPSLPRRRDEQPDRVAIALALEALEVGDQAGAVEILLAALEDGPGQEGSAERLHLCLTCGLGFEWPGLLEAHVFRVHPDELELKAA